MEKSKKIILIVVAVLGVLILCCGGTIIAGIVFKEQLKTEEMIQKYLGIDLNGGEKDGDEDDNGGDNDDNDDEKVLTPEEALEALKGYKDILKNSKEEAEGSMAMNMDMSFEGETMSTDTSMDFTMEYLADYEKKLVDGRMDIIGSAENTYDPYTNISFDYGYEIFVNDTEVFYKKDGDLTYSDTLDLGNDFSPPTDFENFWEDDENSEEIISALEYYGEEKYNDVDCYKYIINDPEKVIELVGEDLDFEDLAEQGFTINLDKTTFEYWIDKKTGLPVGVSAEIEITANGSQQGMDLDLYVGFNMKQVYVEINKGVDIEIPRELR